MATVEVLLVPSSGGPTSVGASAIIEVRDAGSNQQASSSRSLLLFKQPLLSERTNGAYLIRGYRVSRLHSSFKWHALCRRLTSPGPRATLPSSLQPQSHDMHQAERNKPDDTRLSSPTSRFRNRIEITIPRSNQKIYSVLGAYRNLHGGAASSQAAASWLCERCDSSSIEGIHRNPIPPGKNQRPPSQYI